MSSDGDDRRTFLGFEIFHSGIFWARKILIYVGFFLRIQNILHNVINETEDVLRCFERC